MDSVRSWQTSTTMLKSWVPAQYAQLAHYSGPNDDASAVAVSGDGRVVVTISGREIESWELNTGASICMSPRNSTYGGILALSDDGTHALVAEGRVLWVWNTKTGARIDELTLEHFITCIAISRYGLTALAGTDNGLVWLWNLQDGQAAKILPDHTGEVSCVAIARDGDRAVSVSRDCTVRLWHLPDGKSIAELSCDGPLTAAAISEDGTLIMAGEESGRIHFLRLD